MGIKGFEDKKCELDSEVINDSLGLSESFEKKEYDNIVIDDVVEEQRNGDMSLGGELYFTIYLYPTNI